MRITLCGSTRFKKEFQAAEAALALHGHTVYSCAMWGHGGDVIGDQDKLMLDAVHMSKIANSEMIFVLNVGGYIGESTLREIYFAHAIGRRVRFLVDDATSLRLQNPNTVRPTSVKPSPLKV